MQIYWWAYDYQLEIFQSINFPNQWKSAYIWHTIPLLTVIFGFEQLSSEAQSQIVNIHTHAQTHEKSTHSQPVSYHRANTPEKLWLWHDLRHWSFAYGSPLAYHIRSLIFSFSLSLIFAIWMRIDLRTCSFMSVLCGLQMTFIYNTHNKMCMWCPRASIPISFLNDCVCTIAWRQPQQRWWWCWWWWYARTSPSPIRPTLIVHLKNFHMIRKYLLTNYHRT